LRKSKKSTNVVKIKAEFMHIPAFTQNSPIIASGFVVGVCVREDKIRTAAFFKGNCSRGYQNTS